MKPLHPSEAIQLASSRPLLLLNKSRLVLSLVDSAVHRNASSITTKRNRVAFPLEVWDLIIEFALEDRNSDEYSLVRPCTLQREEGETSGFMSSQTLVCDEYEQHATKYSELALQAPRGFQLFLENPDTDDENLKYFKDPLPRPTGNVFAVNLGALDNQKRPLREVLFGDINEPDIISWLDRGYCTFCGSSGDVDPDQGTWLMDMYAPRPRYYGTSVPCPFCIGGGYTSAYLGLIQEKNEYQERDEEGGDWEDKEWAVGIREEWRKLDEELEKWKKELGYEF